MTNTKIWLAAAVALVTTQAPELRKPMCGDGEIYIPLYRRTLSGDPRLEAYVCYRLKDEETRLRDDDDQPRRREPEGDDD